MVKGSKDTASSKQSSKKEGSKDKEGKKKKKDSEKGSSSSRGSRGSKSARSAFPGVPPAITYRRADPKYIELGWTVIPEAKKTHEVVTYKAKLTKPINNWFTQREAIEVERYPTGKVFAKCYKNGTGKVYYPNGRVAIQLSVHETGQRLVLMHPARRTEKQVLAGIFDMCGNGVVYSPDGVKRLMYTQLRGVLLDTRNGLPVKWVWPSLIKLKTLSQKHRESVERDNRSSIRFQHQLQKAFFQKDSFKEKIESLISKNASMANKAQGLGHDRDRSAQSDSTSVIMGKKNISTSSQTEKVEETTEVNCTPVKPIIMKINDFISFRLMSQANIRVTFTEHHVSMSFELGVTVNPSKAIRTDQIELPEIQTEKVQCQFELLPTSSLQELFSTLPNNVF